MYIFSHTAEIGDQRYIFFQSTKEKKKKNPTPNISPAEKQAILCSSLSALCMAWEGISKREGLPNVLQVFLWSVHAQPSFLFREEELANN